jgi:hypothetical protein
MNKYRLLFLFKLIALISCDSGVIIDNVSLDDLYSVNSFISPQDTLFTVYVHRALSYGDIDNPDLALVKDAQVIISNNQTADTLFYNEGQKRYQVKPKNLILKQYHQCFISVRTVSGLELKSSCTIPPDPELPLLTGQRIENDYHVTISWNNPSSFPYFTLVLFGEGYYEYTHPWGTVTEQVKANLTEDIIFPSNNQTEYNEYKGIVSRAFLADNPQLTVSLRNVEPSLYTYFENYREFSEWDANNIGSLLPNFRQPSPVFSNIENGVGIFTAYNSVNKKIDIN